MNETNQANAVAGSDVLSTSGNDRESELHGTYQYSEAGEDEDEDEDDDDASLLDSLEVHSFPGFSLPTQDGSGQFAYDGPSSEDDTYLGSLTKNDYITNRIDSWRREQARILIDDLNHGSDSETSRSETNEVLASWGVDDSDLTTGSRTQTQTPAESEMATDTEETYSFSQNKRFYGDDIFKGLTVWEVDKIKEVAKQMSSSLKRTDGGNRVHLTDKFSSLTSGRRLRQLMQLTATTNRFLLDSMNQPFWKQDISSVHSSLSMDTGSIMFGNLHLADVL
jgi:hypothetical protein